MNILFLSLGDYRSSLYGSLACYFASKGHCVTMIVPTTSGDVTDIEVNSVHVSYFKAMPMSGIGIVKKGIANLLFPYQCTIAVKSISKHQTFDLVLTSTPPLGFYKSLKLIKTKFPLSKNYLILRDIWPEAFNLFNFENKYPLIYKFFRSQERKLYKYSDVIGCMSQGNIDFVAKSNPEVVSKLRMLPNWGAVVNKPVEDRAIREKYGLLGKYVLIYGGNMSVPQGLDNILQLAHIKRGMKDVVFLLIGKGTEKERIKSVVEEEKLDNVRIFDFLPKEDYEAILRTCDVGLISLNDKLRTPSIPSKTISYWELRMPILAIVDHVTDYGKSVLSATHSGVWAYSGDEQKMSDVFDQLYYHPDIRKQMGENGYKYLKEECNLEKTYERIMSQIYE